MGVFYITWEQRSSWIAWNRHSDLLGAGLREVLSLHLTSFLCSFSVFSLFHSVFFPSSHWPVILIFLSPSWEILLSIAPKFLSASGEQRFSCLIPSSLGKRTHWLKLLQICSPLVLSSFGHGLRVTLYNIVYKLVLGGGRDGYSGSVVLRSHSCNALTSSYPS